MRNFGRKTHVGDGMLDSVHGAYDCFDTGHMVKGGVISIDTGAYATDQI